MRTIGIGTPIDGPTAIVGVCFGVVVMAGVGLAMIQRNLRRWPLLVGAFGVGVVLVLWIVGLFSCLGQMRAEFSSGIRQMRTT